MPAHNWLCRYQYDALDRLAGRLPGETSNEQCFYQTERLSTVVEGQCSTSWLHTTHLSLAKQQRERNKNRYMLIATDKPGSAIHGIAESGPYTCVYTPYGYRKAVPGHLQLPGFNRERPDMLTGHYLLGNGYRAFNPVLMRFNSPDNLSPFGKGGPNAYMYCAGDPVNRSDPDGHLFQKVRKLWGWLVDPPPATTLTKLGEDIFSFEKLSKNGKTLKILGHGTPQPVAGYHPMNSIDGTLHTPHQLYWKARDSGIDFSSYDKIHLIMCNSAVAGDNSFAARFSALTHKPVKGYVGTVQTNRWPEELSTFIRDKSHLISQVGDNRYIYTGDIRINKQNPYFSFHPEYTSFTYQPRRFQRYRYELDQV
ncbi:hypothetical protein NJC38_25345 [Pseudomonas sp. 21LCFQ010]|uniref:RHS repeat-associated core domain-containing protein n=1 Tax=Pseudomonas sp. 21LCFQ010 TaxID=2957506 RepID=UPI0020982F3F|nr:RHS repeat-associated core domain-containing protein [Pseudomonas sp. 21LCFQ010]MCO8165467.1 hypothetical protein [Pseudomonas sp. 21LCFQ010]